MGKHSRPVPEGFLGWLAHATDRVLAVLMTPVALIAMLWPRRHRHDRKDGR